MMKKILLIGLLMLMLGYSQVRDFDNADVVSSKLVQNKTFVRENSVVGKTNYTYVKERIIIGYKKAYKNLTIFEEVCKSVRNNVTLITKNVCETYDYITLVVDNKSRGDPIYEEEIISLEIMNESFDFVDKGCYPCDGFVVCLSKKDGYSPNRDLNYQCNLRSGESGWMKNLSTNKIIKSRSDVGVVK